MRISPALLSPGSIAVIGASNDVSKPGGKVLQNILRHGFKGRLFGVNPKQPVISGVQCFTDAGALPGIDLAIIAIAAEYVPAVLETLTRKGCKDFIVFSAGF